MAVFRTWEEAERRWFPRDWRKRQARARRRRDKGTGFATCFLSLLRKALRVPR